MIDAPAANVSRVSVASSSCERGTFGLCSFVRLPLMAVSMMTGHRFMAENSRSKTTEADPLGRLRSEVETGGTVSTPSTDSAEGDPLFESDTC